MRRRDFLIASRPQRVRSAGAAGTPTDGSEVSTVSSPKRTAAIGCRTSRSASAPAQRRRRDRTVSNWIIIHWFELSSLILLGLNLWFIFTVLTVLRETNRWLAILSPVLAAPTSVAP